MVSVRSFDVFDTVLTRRVGAPTALVQLLSRRLAQEELIPTTSEEFASARMRYERRLIDSQGRHPNLHEIYSAVADALSVDPGCIDRWVGEEQDEERALIVALPGAREMVLEARASADLVIFVSDTPHTEPFLRELLEQAGLVRDTDRVFTSADRGATKARGALYRLVGDEFGADTQFVHVGDSPGSDLAARMVKGWSSSLLPAGRLNRYERLLERSASGTSGLSSWLAGASRIARLEAGKRGSPAPVAGVASGVLGPLLLGFALWVVGRARQLGVQRLYFVARDGQVMLQAARHVIEELAPDIKVCYLYGSRQPWMFAASASSDDLLSRWVTVKSDFTARTALARVALTPGRVFELTGLACAAPARADAPLTAKDRTELAGALQREPLLPVVRAAAEKTAQEMMAYLRQEGLADGVRSALVDAGWGGGTAAAFDEMVRRVGGTPVQHLVIGILEAAINSREHDGVDMCAWLFDEYAPHQALVDFPAPNVPIEMLCAGLEGRTLGYRRHEGAVQPVLASATNDPVVDWGLEDMQRTALRVCELVAPHLPQPAVHLDATGFTWDVLRAFWNHPTPAEARHWGSFPWEEETWPPFTPVAQRITAVDVLRRFGRGDHQIRRVNSWRAGSAMASAPPWRVLLKARAWQSRNAPRIRRIPSRIRLEIATRVQR